MKTRITSLLRELEAGHNITILFACESGSRGWEFPSPDSDYDVRFIFIRKASEYLKIGAPEDVISLPIDDELDVYGWDLRKVLTLLMKSNVTPFEWLQSPIVYFERPGFRKRLWTLCRNYFNPRSNAFHYLGIARGFQEKIDGNTIGIKKLFYILRPLLAADWCLSHQTIAPMRFAPLATLLPEDLRTEIQTIIIMKSTLPESAPVSLSAALLDFIRLRFDTLQTKAATLEHRTFDIDALNRFFLQSLSENDHTGT